MSYTKGDYEILGIGNVQVRAVKHPTIEEKLAQHREAIEEVWKKTLHERGKKFFNGTLASCVHLSKKGSSITVDVCFIEYKHFIAQQEAPHLNLNIKPMGVSGITIVEDENTKQILFAKRAMANEYQGLIELVPSGGIDKECIKANGIIDYLSKLQSEFTEETGLSKRYVKGLVGFALVLDRHHHVYDICCKISLSAKKETVLREFKSKEYRDPFLVDMESLDRFIKENASYMVPTSKALVAALIAADI